MTSKRVLYDEGRHPGLAAAGSDAAGMIYRVPYTVVAASNHEELPDPLDGDGCPGGCARTGVTGLGIESTELRRIRDRGPGTGKGNERQQLTCQRPVRRLLPIRPYASPDDVSGRECCDCVDVSVQRAKKERDLGTEGRPDHYDPVGVGSKGIYAIQERLDRDLPGAGILPRPPKPTHRLGQRALLSEQPRAFGIDPSTGPC